MRHFSLYGTSRRRGGEPVRLGPAPARIGALALAALALAASPAAAQDAESLGDAPADGGATAGHEASAPREGTAEGETTQEGRISISADRSRIRLGQSITLSGSREPARKGDLVKIRYRRAGGQSRTVERVRTDAQGDYRTTVKIRRNGSFHAVSPDESGGAVRSAREEVWVRAKVRVRARTHQLKARGVKVRGKVRPGTGGRRVTLERQTGKGWERVDATKTRSTGAYRFRWSPPGLGGYVLRARFRGDELNRGDRTPLGKRLHVYREDHASYYGPGFYGNTTACGQTLTRRTVGVAHKRIRCGRKVRFYYRGTTKRIPVIDRGPYIAGRRWDLTNAARKRLGFPKGTDDIWANR